MTPDIAREFPDYPTDSLPKLPRWLVPTHWHHDAAPSWEDPLSFARVFVDYPYPADRELQDSARYWVGFSDGSITYVETDSWSEALHALRLARRRYRYRMRTEPHRAARRGF